MNIGILPSDRLSIEHSDFMSDLLYFDSLLVEEGRYELTFKYLIAMKNSLGIGGDYLSIKKLHDKLQECGYLKFLNVSEMVLQEKYFEKQNEMGKSFWGLRNKLDRENLHLTAEHENFFKLFKIDPKNEGLSTQFQEVIWQGYLNEYNSENLTTRFRAALMQSLDSKNNYYSVAENILINDSISTNKSDIIITILNSFPIPSSRIKLEKLIEFKNDSETRDKFLSLKNWVNEVSKSNLTLSEIKDKTEYLTNEYEKGLLIHKLKYKKGKLQIIAETTAEMIENLAKLKFSSLISKLFAWNENKIKLMEGERNLIGREISYLIKAQEYFKAE